MTVDLVRGSLWTLVSLVNAQETSATALPSPPDNSTGPNFLKLNSFAQLKFLLENFALTN